MDLSTGVALLSMFSLNIQLEPSPGEMEKRYEAETKLREDITKRFDDTMPIKKDGYLQLIPLLHVDHIHDIQDEQGVLKMALTFTFTWMDERLMWNPSNYSGIRTFSTTRHEMWRKKFWTPTLMMTDVPNSRRPSDVFKPFDMDIYISSSGMVRTSARMMLTIPCRTGFGSYPNDYKNCTFTLMSPYYADQFRFAQWGGAEFTRYLMSSRVTDVLDFQLINIDTRNYYMFLGSEVVDDFSKFKPRHCRSFYRYNLVLKRVNKFVSVQLIAPISVIAVFLAISGFLPHFYGLVCAGSALVYETIFTYDVEQVLPKDYSGMPMIAILLCFLFAETIVLLAWKVFSINTRSHTVFTAFPEYFDDEITSKKEKLLKFVIWVDKFLMVALFVQSFVVMYLARI
ncbi:Acetylcholine receptor-like protein cup-4 [Caenorhabditis elegans]|uniref:Acetylcholine receptor-like protein cup-4 n=1 Tax=Caenorhabditis elegans TaxID=6239 RepID=Q4W520_CAEEL|nr:Neurotransmitter-gated ion-channel ligand-binding domain-containing protein [Caenorhabditis elegans]CCD68443.1 Neurotransmitter-gated ion-channel ligand-binding domain-containing protein [Caenorhabditis elegans]|eukprot:NP_001022053.1 Ligand-Gated ion Channel [Caenorhabditis elegans]